ncbi:MAG: hypothetical protein KDD69_05770 [Bdellovibrionales bacterium]|nr:hypothetical protein [Bdellovibrionales bacterium]
MTPQRLKVLFVVGLSLLTSAAGSGCSSSLGGSFLGRDTLSRQSSTSGRGSAKHASLPLEVDVFSARGFLGGSEYERYVLNDDVMWRECGSIAKRSPDGSGGAADIPEDLEGNDVLPADPNLAIEQRRVEPVNEAQQSLLKELALAVLETAEHTDRREPPPGSFFSLSDPGLFELNIRLGERSSRILTSVDAVADRQSPSLAKAHDLFATLRGIGPTICDAPTFFGITRLSSE